MGGRARPFSFSISSLRRLATVSEEGRSAVSDIAWVLEAAVQRGCHLATIKRNDYEGKNKDLDCWYSKIRSPYERVFSQRNRRVRYRGVAKNQFAAFFNATVFN